MSTCFHCTNSKQTISLAGYSRFRQSTAASMPSTLFRNKGFAVRAANVRERIYCVLPRRGRHRRQRNLNSSDLPLFFAKVRLTLVYANRTQKRSVNQDASTEWAWIADSPWSDPVKSSLQSPSSCGAVLYVHRIVFPEEFGQSGPDALWPDSLGRVTSITLR